MSAGTSTSGPRAGDDAGRTGADDPTPRGALAADDAALRALLDVAATALTAGRQRRSGPTPAGPPTGPRDELAALLGGGPSTTADDGRPGERSGPTIGTGALPATGIGDAAALAGLVELLAAGHTDPADPSCAAHLHCPPLAVAVAADAAVSVLNPSLDSWDQGPSSAAAEDAVIAALAGLIGFDPAAAGGTMTTGATASTLTGLLLAREALGPDVRIACSELAHFSVSRAAQVLGLRAGAVVSVPVDDRSRMRVDALRELLAGDGVPGRTGVSGPDGTSANNGTAADGGTPADRGTVRPTPWIVVATAGTTDLGAIDPLVPVGTVAREHGAWLHVDAAYGGGALFSDRLAPLLTGIDRADSVAMDLHKLGWQPVAAGALIVRDRARTAPMDLQVAYLNAADDDEAGYEDRLGRSLRTTRRPDAFKLLVTMRALGREGLGALVDTCHDLARVAEAAVESDAALELHSAPTLTTILLRPVDDDPARRDERCARVRRRLLREGRAVIGRTEVQGDGPGRRWLKLTLLNPAATAEDVRALVGLVAEAAASEDGDPRTDRSAVGRPAADPRAAEAGR